MKKKNKNSQPQTKFTGSYKKKECIVNSLGKNFLMLRILLPWKQIYLRIFLHCVESVRIRSQIRTRITLNTDTFCAVLFSRDDKKENRFSLSENPYF